PRPELVERAGDSHEQALHSAREGAFVVRFGDQVDVIRLQRVLREAELATLAHGTERAFDHRTDGVPSEVRQAVVQTHGDVNRMVRRERISRPVRHARSRSSALAPCSAPLASPWTEFELGLTYSISIVSHERISSPLTGRSSTTRVATRLGKYLRGLWCDLEREILA